MNGLVAEEDAPIARPCDVSRAGSEASGKDRQRERIEGG